MKPKLLLLFAFFTSSFSFSQSIKDYITEHIIPIQSIQPSDTNFADLASFAKAIEGKSIVLLGEQDHGDAPAFLAKTRLIKFLHQKMNFDVIAFESDFYSLLRGWTAYKSGNITISQLIEGNIFPIWTKCDATQELLHYIQQTQNSRRPLTLTGFDNQLHGSLRKQHYKENITSLLKEVAVPPDLIAQVAPLLSLVQINYPLGTTKDITIDSLNQYISILSNIKWHTDKLPDSSEIKILVNSLNANVYQAKYRNEGNYMTMTVRDEQMAHNLEWIVKHLYPGKKIIVWAHNYHVAKNTVTAMAPKSGKHTAMGHVLSQSLGNEMYILGFTSYEGKAGRIYVSPFKVPKPKSNSLEKWIASKGFPYAFVDLKNTPPGGRNYFSMKGKFHRNEQAIWNEVFDGVFYIQTMYPCQRVD